MSSEGRTDAQSVIKILKELSEIFTTIVAVASVNSSERLVFPLAELHEKI